MKKILIIVTIFFSFLYSEGFGDFASKSKFLSPQEAFQVKADAQENGVNINIKLGDKIHIYKDELKFRVIEPNEKSIDIALPTPKVYGDKEGYDGELNITIPYSKIGESEKFKLEVGLTGCSDDGICYSPQKYHFDLGRVRRMDNPKLQKDETQEEENKSGFKAFASKSKFLSPKEAFKVTTEATNRGVEVKIALGDKIHIYKDELKFKVLSPKEKNIDINLPKGKIYGDKEGYEGNLALLIPYDKIGEDKFTLEVALVGCSDSGICYSPQKYKFNLETKGENRKNSETKTAENSKQTKENESFFGKLKRLVENGNSKEIVEALKSEGIIFILLLFFIVGLLLALTPCILPMIPILSSILIQQAGKSKEGLNKKESFTLSLIYVASMAAAYAVIGVVAGLLNFDLQAHANNPIVILPIALIFIALALSLFGYFELALPSSLQSKLNSISSKAQGKGYFGTAVMGAISALVVGACTAPVISGAVIFISLTGDALLGGLALFIMGIGAGVPLLLVGLGANRFVPKPGGWMENVSKIFGILMILMALYIARGVLSDTLFMFLFSITLIATAIYFGIFEGGKSKGADLLFKVINFTILLYGVIIFIGMIGGANSIISPLKPFTSKTIQQYVAIKEGSHKPKSYTLKELLDEIKNSKKPVVVDIGKDNCAACTELNEITFPDPKVKEELKRFKFIKLDITKYTKDDQDIMEHFNIFGAPNILIFNSRGEPLEDKFIQGFIKPYKFVEVLKGVN